MVVNEKMGFVAKWCEWFEVKCRRRARRHNPMTSLIAMWVSST